MVPVTAESSIGDINDAFATSDFERQIFARLGRALDKDGTTMKRIFKYKTQAKTLGGREQIRNKIKEAVNGKRWKDGKKFDAKLDAIQEVECDFYVSLDPGYGVDSLTAHEFIGGAIDTAFPINLGEGDPDWKEIDLARGYFLMEVTSEPWCIRHKLYQLVRAVNELNAVKKPELKDIKLLAISVNGDESEFSAACGELKSEWDKIWGDSTSKRSSLRDFNESFSKIPLVIFWTKRRNIYSAVHEIQMDMKSFRNDVERDMDSFRIDVERRFQFLTVAVFIGFVVMIIGFHRILQEIKELKTSS